jgi:uncharacterized protein YdeI (YjbR/CyaY-like superfamily)
MESYKELPVGKFPQHEDWIMWLDQNHQSENGLWVKLSKKGSSETTITYEQAREGALIYGWVDGLVNALDENFYLIRFTPRGPKSNWSKINRGVVEGLIKEGRMKPAGLAVVEAAKSDGRWEAAYEPQSSITIPEQFQKALDSNPKAKAKFSQLTSSQRYSFLYRLHTAKKKETYERRIKRYIELLNNGETL